MSWELEDAAVPVPIDGILDLHSFAPKDLKSLIPEYLEECRARDILEVLLIHGKGIGNIRRSVHALLQKNLSVVRYHLAGQDAGGWGATVVYLLPSEGRRNSG